MATQVSIANQALGLLGISTPITSLAQAGKSAWVMNLYMQDTIDEILRAAPWKRAKKRALFTRDATAPVFEYTYRYIIPSDALRIFRGETIQDEWKIEGQFIVTNYDTFYGLYIARITVNDMDPLTRLALVHALAAKAAFPLTNSVSLADLQDRRAQRALLDAVAMDAQEGTPDELDVSNWIDVRA